MNTLNQSEIEMVAGGGMVRVDGRCVTLDADLAQKIADRQVSAYGRVNGECKALTGDDVSSYLPRGEEGVEIIQPRRRRCF